MLVLKFLLISLMCSMHMAQSSNLAALDRIYTYDQVEILERALNRLKSTKEEAHIYPLIHCLENHIKRVITTRIGNDDEKNHLAGAELYGDAVLLLQESLISYFGKYGTVSTSPEPQLFFRALKDFLAVDDAPFVNRGFARDFSSKNETLYVVLPGDGVVERVIQRLQKLIGFSVKRADLAQIEELLGQRKRVAVLAIDKPLRFQDYYLIRYSLEFKHKEKTPNIANMSADVFYRMADDDFQKIN